MIYNQVYKGNMMMLEVVCDEKYVLATRFLENEVSEIPNNITNNVIKQINEYEYGLRTQFKLPFKLGDDFSGLVLKTLAQTQGDRLYTYKELASMCGRPNASRAVGTVMAKNPYPLLIPCHLIVKSDGTVGNYQYGRDLKIKLINKNLKNGGSYE